jgi:amino acid transporter
MLAILPAGDVTRLSGLPDAVRLALQRLGMSGLSGPALLLLALAMLGGYSAWFGVAARLPMVVGVDRYLPAAFGRRSARTGAPVVSILAQTVAVFLLIALGQAGATIKAAYDFLVAMSVISYTLPFVFMFVVYIRVQAVPAPAGAWTSFGGRPGALAVGWTGLVVTSSAIACTLVPSADAPDKAAAVAKLVIASGVLIAAGVGVYLIARRRGSGLKVA